MLTIIAIASFIAIATPLAAMSMMRS